MSDYSSIAPREEVLGGFQEHFDPQIANLLVGGGQPLSQIRPGKAIVHLDKWHKGVITAFTDFEWRS